MNSSQMYPFAVATMQITGSRASQEDSLAVREIQCPETGRGLILVICDGMGGAAGGAIASSLVCDVFLARIGAADSVLQWQFVSAMEEANRRLAERVQADYSLSGMGSTVVAAVVSARRLYWLSVGDSPLWLFRRGRLLRLNADHSMKEVLRRQVQQGVITGDEAQRDISRNALLSVLCGSPPAMVDMPSAPYPLKADDQLLLASDGLESLTEDGIANILDQTADQGPADALARLMATIEQRKNPMQDNASGILLKIGYRQGEQGVNIRLPAVSADTWSSGIRRLLRFSMPGL